MVPGSVAGKEALAGRRDVGSPGVGQHLAVSHDPNADLVGRALEPDDADHGGRAGGTLQQ